MLPVLLLRPSWGSIRLLKTVPTRHTRFARLYGEIRAGKVSLTCFDPQCSSLASTPKGTGLFQVPLLTDPSGFKQLTEQCVKDAQALAKQARTIEGNVQLVDVLDELSNTICVVCDMANFIQYSHTDDNFRKAAYDSVMALVELIEHFNLDMDLVKPLWRLIQNKEVFSAMPPATQRTAQLLWNDFEISGNMANLSAEDRGHCQRLHHEMRQCASELLKVSNVEAWERVDWQNLPDALRACPSLVHQEDGFELYKAILQNPNRTVRRHAFEAIFQPDREAAMLMFSLVQRRHALAKLTGHGTFADRALRSMSAGSVERVQEFLTLLGEKLKPRAEAELSVLHALREKRSRQPGGCGAGDGTVDLNKNVLAQLGSNKLTTDSCECYKMLYYDLKYWLRKAKAELSSVYTSGFSLDNTLSGLNKLLQTTFGVALVRQSTVAGELWAKDVSKFAVMPVGEEEDESRTIGVLYCDLFERPGKLTGECHDTIRCGWSRNGHTQRPISVLRCSLRRGAHFNLECVHALFHEFGHGLHSMLNQPQYQHIAGTRGPVDFAEVPSELMEFFASDSRIISLLLNDSAGSSTAHLADTIASDKLFKAIHLQEQVALATFDLEVHLCPPPNVDALIGLHSRISNNQNSFLLPDGYDLLNLKHTEAYGSTYYSYMWSQATASLLWQHLFKKDPFSRQSGKHYVETILSNGKSRSPNEMVADALGYTPSVEDLVNALVGEIDQSVDTLLRRQRTFDDSTCT